MTRFLLRLLLLATLAPATASACDVCGCGVGSPYAGLVPDAERLAIGLRLRSSAWRSHLTYGERFRTEEHFLRSELWTRVPLSDAFQASVTIPWASNNQVLLQSGTRWNQQGIGDIVLGLSWLWSAERDLGDDDAWLGSLVAGAAVSLPTGRWQYDVDGTDVANANFQMGTGSVDPMVTLTSTLRTTTTGVQLQATARIPTENGNRYRFGTSLTSFLSAFHIVMIDDIRLLPHIDLTVDVAQANSDIYGTIPLTGGWVVAPGAGLDCTVGSMTFQAMVAVPVAQNMGNGALASDLRWTLGITTMPGRW